MRHYLYFDNAKTLWVYAEGRLVRTGTPVFGCFAASIGEADEKLREATGLVASKVPSVGCVVM